MKTLNFIPLPLPGESASSVLYRLASQNGYTTVSRFGAYFLGYGYSATGGTLIQGNRYQSIMLAQVGASLGQAIRSGFYPLADQDAPSGAFLLGAVKVGRRLLRSKNFPVCSECRKSGQGILIHDLCLSRYCPVHHRELIFSCPKCNRRFTLRNQGWIYCVCGKELDSPECSRDICVPEQRLMQIFEQQDQQKLDSLMSVISAFGVARNTVRTLDHSVFDAAISVVFGDLQRLKRTLPDIWNSLDSVQAEILSTLINKEHPNVAPLVSLLPKQIRRGRVLSANRIRLLLGVSSTTWDEFMTASATENKNEYDAEDIEKIKKKIDNFKAVKKELRQLLESETISSSHSLQMIGKLLVLSRAECAVMAERNLLTPFIKIRTRPYYRKEDIKTFQKSFIGTRALAAQLDVTHIHLQTALNCCEKIGPLINRAGNPFLIRTRDIEALTQSLKILPSKTNSLKGWKMIRQCDTSNLATCTLEQAASDLKIHRSSVIYYRDLGLIRCSSANSRVFIRDDVINLYKRFTTPSLLAKELFVPATKITRTLESHNIHAISGPLVNGHCLSVYDRRQFPANLASLINPTSDTYGICFSRNQIMSIGNAAKALELTDTDLRKIAVREIRPTRSEQFRHHESLSFDEVNSLKEKLSHLTNISDLLQKFNMPHRVFARRFASSGFVSPVRLRNQEFLTPADAWKFTNLMENYCTSKQAAKMLGVSCEHAILLIKENNISTYQAYDYDHPQPLLSRQDLEALVKVRSGSTK